MLSIGGEAALRVLQTCIIAQMLSIGGEAALRVEPAYAND